MTVKNCLPMILATMISGMCILAVNAADTVRVQLKSGKRLDGQLHARTSDTHLWLSFGNEHVRVLRRLSWDEVESIRAGERSLGPAEAQQMAQTLTPATVVAHDPTPPAPTSPATPAALQPVVITRRVEPSPVVPPPAGRVQTIRVDAVAANWDGDVEVDGLLAQLVPLDEWGRWMPVNGHWNVELWVMRRVDQDAVPQSGGRLLERLGRWTVPAMASSDLLHDHWIKLPFQVSHPEFDVTWSPVGLIHAELVAPGHGVFHHTLDGIRVRPFAPNRDFLERQTGERFLPGEHTGRGKRVASPYWPG